MSMFIVLSWWQSIAIVHEVHLMNVERSVCEEQYNSAVTRRSS